MRKGFRCGRLERKATSVTASLLPAPADSSAVRVLSDSANPVLG